MAKCAHSPFSALSAIILWLAIFQRRSDDLCLPEGSRLIPLNASNGSAGEMTAHTFCSACARRNTSRCSGTLHSESPPRPLTVAATRLPSDETDSERISLDSWQRVNKASLRV